MLVKIVKEMKSRTNGKRKHVLSGRERAAARREAVTNTRTAASFGKNTGADNWSAAFADPAMDASLLALVSIGPLTPE